MFWIKQLWIVRRGMLLILRMCFELLFTEKWLLLNIVEKHYHVLFVQWTIRICLCPAVDCKGLVIKIMMIFSIALLWTLELLFIYSCIYFLVIILRMNWSFSFISFLLETDRRIWFISLTSVNAPLSS